MKTWRYCAIALLLASPGAGTAGLEERLQAWFQGGLPGGADQILPPEEAFRLHTQINAERRSVEVRWQIADGYYLYRDKFRFGLEAAPESTLEAALASLPEGELKSDPSFGEVRILRGDLQVELPLRFPDAAPASIQLILGYQGCKENSVCYPPITQSIPLWLDALVPAAQAAQVAQATTGDAAPPASTTRATDLLQAGGWRALLAFAGFGLLLAFTPCVFPMIPILSGIIVGQGKRLTVPRSMGLTLAYVLAMALCYAALGVVAGALNFNLQAEAQNPWLLGAFSTVLVLLALSMFGCYELQLPAPLRNRLTALSERQRGGTLAGAAIMGALAALLTGPCIAPPMLAALLYINQSGDALFGGAALFAMGLGFGIPLLVVGASMGSVLPRVGAWMEPVKQVFGVLLLGMAIWFIGRVLPGALTMLLWGGLVIGSAVFMGALDTPPPGAGWARLWKSLGLTLLIYGVALVIGAAGGNHHLLRPLENYLGNHAVGTAGPGEPGGSEKSAAVSGQVEFKQVRNLEELRGELLQARREQRPVMLDFYADWCIVCKELETYTFTDPEVRRELERLVLLQADVTDNELPARQLLEEFKLFGPPAVLFFDEQGQEQSAYRVHEFLDADAFLRTLRGALAL